MEFFWLIVVMAFFFEALSLSTGMGFGTKLAPFLFLIGFNALQIVPAILIAQVISGLVAGMFHHEFENIQLSVFPLNKTTKVILLLILTGCVTIALSVFLTYVLIKPPEMVIQVFVSIVVIVGGVASLVKGYIQKTGRKNVELESLAGFGALAGLVKGIGGSGYGPTLTLGQLYAGVYEKSAIGIMPLAESGVAVVGVMSFFFFRGTSIDLILLPSVFTGSYFAAILSPYIVRAVPNKVWTVLIPTSALVIGIASFLKLFLL